jgi:hypothetical protein
MVKIILFAQIFKKINKVSFNKLLQKFESNKHCKGNDAFIIIFSNYDLIQMIHVFWGRA